MGHQKQGYLYGTVILAAGTVAVKLIGAFFKIPLTNLLGGVGMSYFNVAYDLYYPLYALFISGVPIAVSKLVSESAAKGCIRDVRRVLRIALLLFVTIGICGTLLMLLGGAWFADLVKNPDSKYAVWMLAPALLFGCATAAFRGYWQGMQDMKPTAVSQIVEAVTKLLFGLFFAYAVTNAGMRQFEATGFVFGIRCPAVEQAYLTVLPFAAAGAILGVTASGFCGMIYMVFLHKKSAKHVYLGDLGCAPRATPMRTLTKNLAAIAVPVCIASLITNLTSFIDLISVMNRLTSAISKSGGKIAALYAGAIPEGVGTDKLASYLYGCYSGLAAPLYNLVPSLTAAIGVSLLPAVAAAWAVHDRRALSINVSSALRISAMLAMPAGLGICAMAEPVMRLIYFAKPMEVTVIAPALRLMGLSAIFVALTLPLNAILQAVGRAGYPVRLLLIGGVLKLACNYLLVGVWQLNVQAAPVGTLVCYLFVLAGSLSALLGATGIEVPLFDTLGKPLLSAIGCAVTAQASYRMMQGIIDPRPATLLAISAGAIIYIILLFSVKAVKKADILMICKGEKFINLLEKHNLLG